MANNKPEDIAKKFLQYSFNDISDKYDGLTKEEKALCTKEEFEELVQWMNQKKEG